MQAFNYIIFFNPKEDTEQGAKVLAGPTAILAKDLDRAKILAARAIPEEYVSKLSQVEVIVRNF